MAPIAELIAQAQSLLESDPAQVPALCRQAVTLDPADEAVYSLWRMAITKLNGPEEELEAYADAVERNLDSAASEYETGLLFAQHKKYHKANHWFKRAVEREEPGFDYLMTYLDWGSSLFFEGEYSRAISRFKKAVELDPANKRAYESWRASLRKLEDTEEEVRYYRKKIELNLKNAQAYDELGQLLCDLKKYDEAIEAYEHAWELREDGYDYPSLLVRWGACLVLKGDPDGAIGKYLLACPEYENKQHLFQEWQNAIELAGYPAHRIEEYTEAVKKYYPTAEGFQQAGFLMMSDQQWSEAVRFFEKAIAKHDPGFVSATLFIAWGYCLFIGYRNPEAIEKLKKAIDSDPGNDSAYSYWAIAITPQATEKEMKEFRDRLKGKLDRADYNLFYGIALSNNRKYEDSLKYFRKAVALNGDLSDAWYNLGNALMSLFRYEEAMEAYRQAARVQVSNVYASHNLAYLLDKMGRYKQGRDEWLKVLGLYASLENERYTQKDSDFFLNYGSVYHEEFLDLQEAERIYLKGLELNKKNPAILINLVKLYLLMKTGAVESEIRGDLARNEAHIKAWRYFHLAESTLRQLLEAAGPNVLLLNALGELYLTVDRLEEARKAFQKAVEQDPVNGTSLAGLGIVNFRSDNAKEALRCFSEALVQDPDNLSWQNNHAEALLRAERLFEAEKEYQSIQSVSSGHVESLVGLAEIHKRFGDSALERGLKGDAEEMFNQANYYYDRILTLSDRPEEASKIMTKSELSAIYYSKGYVNVKMFELNKDQDCLSTARRIFRKVSPSGQDYYKARRAISKIDERTRTVRAASSRFGSAIIIAFSILLLLAAQWVFFVGRPVVERGKYVFNTEITRLLNTEDTTDLAILSKLRPILKETYFSKEHMESGIRKVLSEAEYDHLASLPHYTAGGSLRLRGFEPVDATTYGLLTFGALIFIATGIYLREITKLKFGVIEMEKSSFDQVSTTTSLEISQSSTEKKM